VSDRFLAVESVSVTYGSGRSQTYALRDVSVDFQAGSLTVIKGPSGSGKTTLLAVLGCLRQPDSGCVFAQRQNATQMTDSQRTSLRRDRIGFVFQAFRLFRSLSAIDNVAMVAEFDGREPNRNLARKRLQQMGLDSKLHLRPNELSGGEKQRVAIARAMMANPAILLADEPTASLDPKSAEQICGLLQEFSHRDGRAVVVVSHDERWNSYADRTVVLANGEIINQTQGAIQ
jgi:putative ABC transport system ATP-binding protein